MVAPFVDVVYLVIQNNEGPTVVMRLSMRLGSRKCSCFTHVAAAAAASFVILVKAIVIFVVGLVVVVLVGFILTMV